MKKKLNLPLAVAVILCAVSLIAMIIVLVNPKTEPVPFAPPPFDPTAQVGTPSVPEDLGWSLLDAKVYRVSVCGNVIVSDNCADVWLTNPAENEVWLKLRVLDQKGNVLGETGLVKPGEYVQTIQFDSIPDPGDAIALKLMAYEPDTYYSAGVATFNTVVGG